MDMRQKKYLLLILLFCLSLLLYGCRTRTGGSPEIIHPDADERQADEAQQGSNVSAEGIPAEGEDISEPGGRTRENAEAARKEYDENASAEIVPGTERSLHIEDEGIGNSLANEESETSADQVNEQAGETAVRTVAADESDHTGVSEDADAADSAMTYFTALLRDKTGSLFECQRLNVYWETAEDHVTIHRSFPEHKLILDAGCYDVSARLLPENLLVDDGWVMRKNPGVIVKIVDVGVLGNGVISDRPARVISENLQNREGWAAIDAVKNHRILLLSRELLEAPHLQTAAMILIAQTANPSLFSDVDPDKMLQMLVEEATGTLPSGIFYYKED